MDAKPNQPREDIIKQLLRGAVDPHVHSGPSSAERGIDHIEALIEADDNGFAAIAYKDHHYSTAPMAKLVAKHHGNLKTKPLSGIVLNNTVGGFNPDAVEHAAIMGGKIVWMPTLAAANHIEWEKSHSHPGVGKGMRPAHEIPVMNGDELRDEVKEVLDVIAQYDMVLAGGHLHVKEIWKVFAEAQRRGVKRLLVNHPEEIIDASMNDVRGLAAMGAYIEHSICLFVDGSRFKIHDAQELDRQIKAATVGQTILASDLGQVRTISPVEGFRQIISMCLDLGYSETEIRAMTSTNAAGLLDLEGAILS